MILHVDQSPIIPYEHNDYWEGLRLSRNREEKPEEKAKKTSSIPRREVEYGSLQQGANLPGCDLHGIDPESYERAIRELHEARKKDKQQDSSPP